MTHVIAIGNLKGGVAKTTSTLSLGAALAELNYRVLLIDLDPQANLALALGLETGESNTTSANILIENASVRNAIRKTDIKNLDLIPSSFRIETAEQFLPMRTHYLSTLHDALKDGFRSFREYDGFLQAPAYANVAFDIHRYQCFTQEDLDLDIFGHIRKGALDWHEEVDELIPESGWQVYCGEWSLGLNQAVVSLWAEGPFDHALDGMDEFQLAAAYRAYGGAQLMSFEQYAGWFFWTYRTETTPEWCYRACVERGFLPSHSRSQRPWVE